MHRHQRGKRQRQDHHVQQIESDQRFFADLVGPEQDLTLQAADVELFRDAQRIGDLARRLRDVGADRDRPVGELVPRKQIAGERQAQRRHQQAPSR